MKKYHITSLIKEILAENQKLQDLIDQRKKVNAELDKIVQDGGEITSSDPLYIKSRFLTKQINKLKNLKEEEKGTLKLKKGTSDNDIKKYTDKDIDVEMVDEDKSDLSLGKMIDKLSKDKGFAIDHGFIKNETFKDVKKYLEDNFNYDEVKEMYESYIKYNFNSDNMKTNIGL